MLIEKNGIKHTIDIKVNKVTPYLTIGLANMSSQKSSSLVLLIDVIDEFMLKRSSMTLVQMYHQVSIMWKGKEPLVK